MGEGSNQEDRGLDSGDATPSFLPMLPGRGRLSNCIDFSFLVSHASRCFLGFVPCTYRQNW